MNQNPDTSVFLIPSSPLQVLHILLPSPQLEVIQILVLVPGQSLGCEK